MKLNTLVSSLKKYTDNESSPTSRDLTLLLDQSLQLAAEHSPVALTGYMSRITYIVNQKNLSNSLIRQVHLVKATLKSSTISNATIESTFFVIDQVLKTLPEYSFQFSKHLSFQLETKENKNISFIPDLRLQTTAIDLDKKQIKGIRLDTGEEAIIQCGIEGRNAIFNSTLDILYHQFQQQATLSLLKIEVSESGILNPGFIVLQPDYLVDVTAIAECFKKDDINWRHYFSHKFQIREVSHFIIIGNVANFFLDTLLADPNAEFQDTFKQTFNLFPTQYAALNDAVVKDIYKQCRLHFENIKKAIQSDFKSLGLQSKHCFIEPSFISPKYGIQGRLDALFLDEQHLENTTIIELKSGRPFHPNKEGISQTHYIQTLLYQLLIRSNFGEQFTPRTYVMYSREYERTLRLAPAVTALHRHAIQIRNEIIAAEYRLIHQNPKHILSASHITQELALDKFENPSPFLKKAINTFSNSVSKASNIEKSYFAHFAAFTAREHLYSKVGQGITDLTGGYAQLWQTPIEEKKDAFSILNDLILEHDFAHKDNPVVILKRSEKTQALANFRVGDIIVLYRDPSPLQGQIFKSSIIALSETHVEVRLRSRQTHSGVFIKQSIWHIEKDMLDSSFRNQYESLVSFMMQPIHIRSQLLTITQPAIPDELIQLPKEIENAVSTKQAEVMQKALSAQDYFLIWGPPGTGKTSFMLRYMVKYLFEQTNERILLLAYTNRAVDEICAAIESNGDQYKGIYTRIGSRYSTDDRFSHSLLDNQIQGIETRQGILDFLGGSRIIVSTVSSMLGKPELFQLIQFDTAIIDEASQLLEPMLVGLLSKVGRFILIGDHLQLPAVVTQPENRSIVREQKLQSIGLNNLRNSFFERLYLRAQTKGWTHAYDILDRQGRMHQDISEFSATHFYGGQLQLLEAPHATRQTQKLEHHEIESNLTHSIKNLIQENRFVFIDTSNHRVQSTSKHNDIEAALVSDLLHHFLLKNTTDKKQDIGIITPYRAQINCITHHLHKRNINTPITIDTVERYQGGARDIIIMSMSINTATQIPNLASLTPDGKVDRKLNVALTRAREQLIVIGNSKLMRYHPIYAKLLDFLIEKKCLLQL